MRLSITCPKEAAYSVHMPNHTLGDRMNTTIRINAETRAKLSTLKRSSMETYDDVILALMSLIPEGDAEGKYNAEFRASLLRSLLDFKGGNIHSMKKVEKQIN